MNDLIFTAELGAHATAVAHTYTTLQENAILPRIWNHDHTIWKPDPTEIANRLGWLHLPQTMQTQLTAIRAFAQEIQASDITDVLLLGMGGSSLAPELFAKTFGSSKLRLQIVDSTHPDTIRTLESQLNLRTTLFIVSTKSGGTVETFSFFKYFYNRVAELVGAANVGSHFVAITDPGSGLEQTAVQYQFRTTFLNDPNIGGRYSALSCFGLVPAALLGIDIAALLHSAESVSHTADSLYLGAILGTLAQAGHDKLTLLLSPALASFGDWVEQLVAESTGKDGMGILPIVGEPLAEPALYGNDRLFVLLTEAGDTQFDAGVTALQAAGHPVVRMNPLTDRLHLGAHFMLWELATAVAGHVLHIQPFDQPNVESAKIQARKMVAAFHETGSLPQSNTAVLNTTTLHAFLSQANPGDYVSIQAYIQPTPATDAALHALRQHIRQQTKLATTVGYGPRFLHSTGQLHKGDSGNGLFIQFLSDPQQDAAIPDEAGAETSAMSFDILIQSQALGDAQALLNENRRFICYNLGHDVVGQLQSLL